MATGDLTTDEYLTTSISSMAQVVIAERARLITAASTYLQKQCGSVLAATALSEEYEPGLEREIRLKNRPVISVDRVSIDLSAAILISYSGSANRATVAYDSVAGVVTLTTNTLGVVASVPIAISAYPTIGLLAAAIATHSGWSATVPPIFLSGMLSDELRSPQGSVSAIGSLPAALWAYKTTLADWDLLSANRGRLLLYQSMPTGYAVPDRMWGADPRQGRVQVVYTAGYAVIPDDLQKATCAMCQFFTEGMATAGIVSDEKIGAYEYTVAPNQSLPVVVQKVINNYSQERRRFS